MFREYAEKGLLVENLDFIQAVNQYINMSEDHVVRWSINANRVTNNHLSSWFTLSMLIG